VACGGAAPESAQPSTPIPTTSETESTGGFTPSIPAAVEVSPSELVLREALRGEDALVPMTWIHEGMDAGGSGTFNLWSDRDFPNNWIVLMDGVDISDWYETDGVSGSVDPTGMLRDNAEITRLDRTTFRFSYTADPADDETNETIHGIWMADLKGMSFVWLEVSLLEENVDVVEYILNDFEARMKESFN
jgi:hypothetical protein